MGNNGGLYKYRYRKSSVIEILPDRLLHIALLFLVLILVGGCGDKTVEVDAEKPNILWMTTLSVSAQGQLPTILIWNRKWYTSWSTPFKT